MSFATAAWQTAWRSVTTRECGAYIAISVPSGPTLRISTVEALNDFGRWEPVLQSDGSLRCPGSFLETRESPALLRFSVFDKPMGLANGLTLSQVIEQYDFPRASITLYLIENSLPFAANALPRFSGTVQTWQVSLGVVEITAIQTRSWNRSIIIKTANRQDDPQVPDDAIGAPKPVYYGQHSGPPARAPLDFATGAAVNGGYGDLYRIQELIRGGRRGVPAVLVDSGRGNGTNRAKVIVASHPVKQLGNFTPNWGSSPMMEGGDGLLHTMDPILANVFNDAAQGAGWFIGEDSTVAFLPLIPVEIEPTSNGADNPLPLLDPKNEFNPARFDWTGLKRNLFLRFESKDNLGSLHATASVAYVVYRAPAGLTNFQFLIYNSALPQSGPVQTLPATSNIMDFRSVAVPFPGSPNYWSSDPYRFSDWRMEIAFTGTGAGTAEVFMAGIAIAYYPRRDRFDLVRGRITVPVQTKKIKNAQDRRMTVYEQRDGYVDVTEMRGRFFANLLGYADDGAGKFTGVAAALIQRPPDVMRHLLEVYGGTTAVATGSSFGSLITARSLLKTWNQRDMIAALSIAQTIDVATALEWIGDSAMAQPILSEFQGTWELHPWRGLSPAVTYLKPLAWENLIGNGIEIVSPTPGSVLSALRLNYGYDAHTQSFLHETSVSASRSVAGYQYRNLRDGNVTVVANVNDRIDFSTNLGGATGNLTPGTYSVWDFVKHFAAVVEGALIGTLCPCFYGPRYETGFNDDFAFNDGAAKVASINGDFATFEDACAALQTAMNGVSTGWTVTYSRATNKVTVDRSSGTKLIGGVAQNDNGWAGMGFDLGTSGSYACPVSSDFPVEEQKIVVSRSVYSSSIGINLLFRTGTNGLLGTKRTCAELLGYDWTSDYTGKRAYVSDSPKTDIEQVLAAADVKYGAKRELPVDLRGVNDTATARELRNRLVALLTVPRVTIAFSSEVHADLRRGDVFEVSADIDQYQPCPIPGSAGSWAGRRFRVLETSQRFGSSWHTDVVAIDMTD